MGGPPRLEGFFTALHRVVEDLFDFVRDEPGDARVATVGATLACWMANEPMKFRLEFARALPALTQAM